MGRLDSTVCPEFARIYRGDMNAPAGAGGTRPDAVLEDLDRAECLRLIAPGGIGRVAFNDGEGPAVIPVNYIVEHGDSVIFRTAPAGRLNQNLTSLISGADVRIAFEVDAIDEHSHEGWSVLLRGGAHHLDPAESEAACTKVTPWAGGERDICIRLSPTAI